MPFSLQATFLWSKADLYSLTVENVFHFSFTFFGLQIVLMTSRLTGNTCMQQALCYTYIITSVEGHL